MSITVKGLTFGYGAHEVLKDVSFVAGERRLLSVLGPNGVGKSTLFRCILGLLRGYTGTVEIDGTDVTQLSARALARRVAYIPQSHYPSFNYSVFDMVLMGTTAQVSSVSPPGARERETAMEALERMGIADFAHRYYTHISGGERQLVLIARALAQQSHTLIMDEPTANLDFGNQMRVMTRIRALAEEGYTIVQSTHSPEQAYLFSHELLAMKDGKLLAQGPPADIMDEALIGALYGIDVEVTRLRDDKFRACIPRELL